MRIAQTRVRFPEKYLTGIADGEPFFVGLTGLQDFLVQLTRMGFSQNFVAGEQVLPSINGKVTRFNANGGFNIRKDLPKETMFREGEIKDWHGNYHTVDIPYQRYPREPIIAPNVELLIRTGADNNLVLTGQVLNKTVQNYSQIKHIINLFLEIFGECEILREDLLPAFNVNITRLNWDVLPVGNYPWARLEPRIREIIGAINQQKRGLVQNRIEKIANFNTNFVAVGRAGFRGYMVFGFPNKDFFILESLYTGNATYVLGENWEQLSQLTKEQILTNNLQQQRIVHSLNWENEINNLLR